MKGATVGKGAQSKRIANKVDRQLTVQAQNALAKSAREWLAESQSPVRIGLVLSGGGLRGASHVGVLQQLVEQLAKLQTTSGTEPLRWIRAQRDPSLAIRFSCINANACKECMMRVDGKTVYACTTRLVAGEMRLEPLPNKKLIKDLVTEIAPPDERLR